MRPTASLTTLRLRAQLLDWLRQFFRSHGYWEVETPALSHDACVDAWLDPFTVPAGDRLMSLQTSPEFAMKRLLAAGADAIFQIARVFRQGEVGPLHNPEFTMVEWYRRGDTYLAQLDFVELLTREFVHEAARHAPAAASVADLLTREPFARLTYDEACARAVGGPVLSLPADRLEALVRERCPAVSPGHPADGRDFWLQRLMVEAVEPHLAGIPAVLLRDFPDSQAALARVRPGSPPVAERFELYLLGVEICNGYQELTDPVELQRRFVRQNQIRRSSGRIPLPEHSRMLDAMRDPGLPESAGVALGFDRLLMVSLGLTNVRDVLAFPWDIA